MKVYADTSVLVAWFYPADLFAEPVTLWHRRESVEFVWNPILRAELRHSLRTIPGIYAGIAWRAYSMAESGGLLKLERYGVNDLIAAADELSARFAGQITCGTWDWVHVAAAQILGAPFVTCDAAQAELASLVGIDEVTFFQ
jgi:predicted nucleic acid-binding protein